MKQIVTDEHVELDEKVLKINVTKHNGCYLEMLEASKSQLDNMLSYHSRVLVLRFDLHMLEYTEDNKLLSAFIHRLRKRLKQKYGLGRVGYIWAREMEKVKRQHYHFALMVSGNAVKHPAKILKLVSEIWERRFYQPQPYTPKRCYYVINRKSNSTYDEAFYRLSYLAKARGKGYKNKAANDYSSSRIKPKLQPQLANING